MSMMTVLKQMDEDRTEDLLERNKMPRFSDDLESSRIRQHQKYKMALKKKSAGSVLNKLLREGDDESMDSFKIVRG